MSDKIVQFNEEVIKGQLKVALMLVCARLRYVAGTQWGNKKYMNMMHLEVNKENTSVAG